MAPTEVNVEWQTGEVIKYLFEDEDEGEAQSRQLDAALETDGPTQSDDESFDPVLIADKLRSLADALDDDVTFKAALTDMKKAAAQEAVDLAFSHGVDAVSQTYVCQGAEATLEIQLLKASVAFGLYVTKSSPELRKKVRDAMNAFVNRRLGTWLTQEGGWDKVKL